MFGRLNNDLRDFEDPKYLGFVNTFYGSGENTYTDYSRDDPKFVFDESISIVDSNVSLDLITEVLEDHDVKVLKSFIEKKTFQDVIETTEEDVVEIGEFVMGRIDELISDENETVESLAGENRASENEVNKVF